MISRSDGKNFHLLADRPRPTPRNAMRTRIYRRPALSEKLAQHGALAGMRALPDNALRELNC